MFRVIELRPANYPAAACIGPASVSQPGCSQAPLPVRAASKLELPACHSDAGAAAATGRTRTSESGPDGPSDPEGAGALWGPLQMSETAAEMLKHFFNFFQSNSTWKINFPQFFSGVHHLP